MLIGLLDASSYATIEASVERVSAEFVNKHPHMARYADAYAKNLLVVSLRLAARQIAELKDSPN